MPRLIGNTSVLRGLNPAQFTDEAFGLPTVNDILKELEKPGRDPRPEFQTATFAEGVHTLEDLEEGMVLEGQVTNVAAFGAFVDIGVHQDGLVHVSAMSRGFVSDPRDIAKPGDVVRVKVLSVDIPRKRISLTMRLDDPADGGQPGGGSQRGSRPSRPRTDSGGSPAPASSARGGDRDRRAGGPRDNRGGSGRDGRGAGGDSRGGGRDARGGAGRSGGRDARGGGRDSRGGGAPTNDAMAEALRKAGLVGDSGKQDRRRQDRP
jgi:uncharacterized protein